MTHFKKFVAEVAFKSLVRVYRVCCNKEALKMECNKHVTVTYVMLFSIQHFPVLLNGSSMCLANLWGWCLKGYQNPLSAQSISSINLAIRVGIKYFSRKGGVGLEGGDCLERKGGGGERFFTFILNFH